MTISKEHSIGLDVLFNHATIGMLLADEQERIVLANPYLLQRLGYEKTEVTGKKIDTFLLLHAGSQTSLHADNGNNPFVYSLQANRLDYVICKDGSRIPFHVSTGSYSNETGKYTVLYLTDMPSSRSYTGEQEKPAASTEEYVRNLLTTIDQLRLRIREDEAKDNALQRLNSFLSSIWNNADAIIIVFSPEGFIRWFNPTAEKQLGYRAIDVIEIESPLLFHDASELEIRAAEFSLQMQQTVDPGLDTLTIKARLNLPNEYEWNYIRRDGSKLPVSLTISAIRSAASITGYVGIAIDISERKRAEAELRQALEKEKELNELKSKFVSLASHEFRTPLSTILSSVYLISQYQGGIEDQYKRDKHIQRIVSSVNMLTDILNDFLSVGKIEEGKIQVRNSTFEPGKLIGTIISEMQGLQKNSQQILYAHHGASTAYLDPTLLKHIVMNLVSNAIKFSPEGGIIAVRSECLNNYLQLTVRDKGIGIAEEDRQHLFERFFRGSNAGNIQGTGLGLHIVGRYTEIMGGTITCDSKPGEGAEFKVIIPFPEK
ncbi:ATP-binding protein [Chitinophaga sp. Cy-1792]|uniref:sensor histidine kinase n=1 Tax=Chitinophaga sp. Cy-1792 TaxID=2608339 RepID=UPI001422A43E|nr:ATP-binding protein [Chitinophaga sp. Cy-1792]NIG57446.1 PAS domain S-box protein [Chitinophaga sp. Cy-1792]